ncbi:MAG: C40 family peptidase [Melioribacteraceae bacterium]|nr:C40 family peptidase [Melioribacteraceae bacterium]MCO6474560.1 C40 family peptidase [Melioribacteraceae bacterium]MDD3558147.1 C40 family peptidase [Melioribacteraceae bacterium]
MKSVFRQITVLILIIFIYSCSSSSTSQRYNKQPEPKEEPKNEVRFSSKDDPDPVKEKENKTVTNPNFTDYADPDAIPEEEIAIDRKEFLRKYDKMANYSIALTLREKIIFEIISYLETPYLYGGNSTNGIDCSAFTQNIISNAANQTIPRTAKEQFEVGIPVAQISELQFGDLVFFDTTRRSYPGHVGIYMGEDLFAHSSQSQGVVISSIQSDYYRNRFVGGRRLTEDLNK